MSSIEWTGLLALGMLFLLLGYLMFKARAKYIRIEIRSDTLPGSMQDQEYESYSYEVERYGCVSLLATVLGVLFFIGAVTSLVVLLYQIVVMVIIPSLSIIFSVLSVFYAIILVLSLVFFMIMAVLGFFLDLFNPPR